MFGAFLNYTAVEMAQADPAAPALEAGSCRFLGTGVFLGER
jgi:hypothetical protein